jgi:hypothetical protein
MNVFRKRHRFIDERIEISFPIGHGNSPRHQAYRDAPGAATLLLSWGVDNVHNWRCVARPRMRSNGARCSVSPEQK